MNERPNPLLAAIDTLTLPRIENIPQRTDDGVYIRTHTVTHPPLLEQLKAAINPSSNTASGSASLKSTRNLIDANAMFEYGKMSSAIGDWCLIWKVGVTRDPIVDLRRWYTKYSAYDHGNDPQFYIGQLNKWAAKIRNLIEPAIRYPVNITCPVCGSRTFTTEDGETNLFPILIEYRRQDGETIKPKATCRNDGCGAEWVGYDAIRELGEEVEERAQTPVNN